MADTMHKINKVEVRNLQMEDYGQLAQSFTRVYADKDVFWTREQIRKLVTIFPEGQIVTVVDGRIVGCALSIIVDYDTVKGDHTYAKVTAARPSTPTPRTATFSTVSRSSSTPTTAACGSRAACTTTARSCARSSTSRRSCSAAASPTTISTPTGCARRSISERCARARFTIRC